MWNIGKHRCHSPIEQSLRSSRIIHGVGEHRITRPADLQHGGQTKALMVRMDCRAAQQRGNFRPGLWDPAEQDAARNMGRVIPRAGKGAPLKAGDQQAGRIGGPIPDERIRDKRSGRRCFPARRLQLDIGAETEFGKESQSLLQLRHALPDEGRIKPVPSIISSDLGKRQRADPAAPVGRALDPAIVEQNRPVVASEPDIEFDPIAAERLRLAETGKGVLGGACGGAAMADHRREDSRDPLAPP